MKQIQKTNSMDSLQGIEARAMAVVVKGRVAWLRILNFEF
jgi:hypothetical protein